MHDHSNCQIMSLTDADLIELHDFLERRCVPRNDMNLAMLDGLLSEFNTVPMYYHSNHWDEPIYGMTTQEAKTRFFTSPEEAERIDDLLWGRLHDVEVAFEEKRFQESILPTDEKAVESWCIGYLRGALLHPQEWKPLLSCHQEIPIPSDIADALEALRSYLESDPSGAPTHEIFRENLLSSRLLAVLPAAAESLHSYSRAYQRATASKRRFNFEPEQRLPLRIAPKPGRNERCPCNSGKKYKKCCGA